MNPDTNRKYVKISVPELKKSQSVTFKLPDYRSKRFLLDRVTIVSSGNNWDLKITSRGNIFLNCSKSLLLFYENSLEMKHFGIVADQSDLLMQLKSLSGNEECYILLEYTASMGLPKFYSEFSIRQPSDRESLMEQVVKEIKKLEVSKIHFLVFDKDVTKINLTDPYRVDDNESYQYSLDAEHRNGISVFCLDFREDIDVDRLSRMSVQCYNSSRSEVYPGQIGVIVFGFQN